MASDLLVSPVGQDLLQRAIVSIEAHSRVSQQPKELVLLETLRIFRHDAKTLHAGAPFTLDHTGPVLNAAVEGVTKAPQTHFDAPVDQLYAWIYRVVLEYELTLPHGTDISFELKAFVNYWREHPEQFTEDAQKQMRHAEQWLPIALLRNLLGSEGILNLRNVAAYSKTVDERVTAWEQKLTAQDEKASALERSLRQYEHGFNFVGLHEGFDDLATAKKTELQWLRFAMGATGLIALLPVSAEIWVVFSHLATIESLKWALLASAVPVVTLTLLLIYFFRLAVRSADAAKSQLMQIELRKTLCRFIQSYADYAKQLKQEGSPSLTKFENVIFSGIVGSEEKIPATFDGMDQIAGLIKAVKTSS
jgi:hypothetical protein